MTHVRQSTERISVVADFRTVSFTVLMRTTLDTIKIPRVTGWAFECGLPMRLVVHRAPFEGGRQPSSGWTVSHYDTGLCVSPWMQTTRIDAAANAVQRIILHARTQPGREKLAAAGVDLAQWPAHEAKKWS